MRQNVWHFSVSLFLLSAIIYSKFGENLYLGKIANYFIVGYVILIIIWSVVKIINAINQKDKKHRDTLNLRKNQAVPKSNQSS